MKAPQRKFVVEFKSSRRQSKASERSIWGNTDFKALVRDVEDEAPHLFKVDGAIEKPDKRGSFQADPAAADPAGYDGSYDLASADGEDAGLSVQQEAGSPTAEAVADTQDNQPHAPLFKTSMIKSQKAAKPVSFREVADVDMGLGVLRTLQPTTQADPVSLDELAALEAENRKLKRLLAEKLYAENLHLNAMLKRFYAT